MENASKALIIAGGILLAMMILSLVIYMSGVMSDWAGSQNRETLTKQIAEFNRSYEVYNKKRTYGTDVITVVNKAIDHNTSVAPKLEDPYYINVIITTTTPFTTSGTKRDNNKLSSDSDSEMSDSDFRNLGLSIIESRLDVGTHELGSWNGDELIMKEGILAFFDQKEKNDIKKSENGKYTYYITSALSMFKRAIFTCEDMKDNNGDGRIDTIIFKQV